MSETIKLVQGDTLPAIILALTDENTGSVIDLSGVGTAVEVKFRAAGTTVVLSTIACSIIAAASGIVQFSFSGGALAAITPGLYEGEIQITFPGGPIQTVFDVLKFRVRGQF